MHDQLTQRDNLTIVNSFPLSPKNTFSWTYCHTGFCVTPKSLPKAVHLRFKLRFCFPSLGNTATSYSRIIAYVSKFSVNDQTCLDFTGSFCHYRNKTCWNCQETVQSFKLMSIMLIPFTSACGPHVSNISRPLDLLVPLPDEQQSQRQKSV